MPPPEEASTASKTPHDPEPALPFVSVISSAVALEPHAPTVNVEESKNRRIEGQRSMPKAGRRRPDGRRHDRRLEVRIQTLLDRQVFVIRTSKLPVEPRKARSASRVFRLRLHQCRYLKAQYTRTALSAVLGRRSATVVFFASSILRFFALTVGAFSATVDPVPNLPCRTMQLPCFKPSA